MLFGGEARTANAAAAPVTAEAVREWNRHARPGEELTYYIGPYLLQSLPAVGAVRTLQQAGEVSLYQRKLAAGCFSYCMQKRAAPERRPLSRAALDDEQARAMEDGLRDLYATLRRLASFKQVCPSNGGLAEMSGLKDKYSVRDRLPKLVARGMIDICVPPQGARIITIIETCERTAAGIEA